MKIMKSMMPMLLGNSIWQVIPGFGAKLNTLHPRSRRRRFGLTGSLDGKVSVIIFSIAPAPSSWHIIIIIVIVIIVIVITVIIIIVVVIIIIII